MVGVVALLFLKNIFKRSEVFDFLYFSDQMASNKHSYYRLRNELGGGVDDEEPDRQDQRALIRKISSWPSKIRRFVIGRRRRTKVRIPGLRKFLRKRKRTFSMTGFKVSCNKVLKRLKNGQAHMGDLFAGNYLFMMQVNPTPFFRCRSTGGRGGLDQEYHHYRSFKYPVVYARDIAKNPGPMY